MTSALVAGLVAGYGVALPFGPIATYLISLGAQGRVRPATAAALGVATTDGLFAALAAGAGGRLRGGLRPIAEPLSYASAAVLVALALRALGAALRRYRARPACAPGEPPGLGAGRAYLRLVGLTALNPTTLTYFSALVLGDRSLARTPFGAGQFSAAVFAASASWQLLLTGGGALLARLLTGRRGQLALSLAAATIMLLLAARVLAR